MPPDRPIRLTFPSNDIGWALILADGLKVGHCVAGFSSWTAYLWCKPGDNFTGYGDVPVSRPRLADLRAELRERVENKGPWWSETAATG